LTSVETAAKKVADQTGWPQRWGWLQTRSRWDKEADV
jgi:hypothetical protein